MRELYKPLIVVTLALLVPILPFISFGDVVELKIQGWLEAEVSKQTVAAIVVGVLATDIFLPVPSSFVSTVGGVALGTWGGTLASWAGLTLGAIIGFAVARVAGQPLAERFTKPEDLARMQRLSRKTGPLVLILVRAVPVMAEASVLLVGATGLSWRRFLPPIIASNLGIALAYSALGDLASRYQTLPIVLAVSIALPVLLATMVRRWLPDRDELNNDPQTANASLKKDQP